MDIKNKHMATKNKRRTRPKGIMIKLPKDMGSRCKVIMIKHRITIKKPVIYRVMLKNTDTDYCKAFINNDVFPRMKIN